MYHHASSCIIIHHHPSSSIIIHHHESSWIFMNHHEFSWTIMNFHEPPRNPTETRRNPTKINENRRKSNRPKSSPIIPNGFPCSKNLPKRPKNARKPPKTWFFGWFFSDPKIVLGWLFGLVEVVSRILGEFRRHHFSWFFDVFWGISGVYQGHIRASYWRPVGVLLASFCRPPLSIRVAGRIGQREGDTRKD